MTFVRLQADSSTLCEQCLDSCFQELVIDNESKTLTDFMSSVQDRQALSPTISEILTSTMEGTPNAVSSK